MADAGLSKEGLREVGGCCMEARPRLESSSPSVSRHLTFPSPNFCPLSLSLTSVLVTVRCLTGQRVP